MARPAGNGQHGERVHRAAAGGLGRDRGAGARHRPAAMRGTIGRGKRGTKHHIAVNGDGVPVACTVAAANVNETLLFERLFRTAFVVMA